MASSSFHWLDYVLFLVMLVFSCGIGVYYAFTGNKQQSKEEFLLGNRKLQWFPVALSLMVSYNSGILQLGVPAEIYLYGIQYLMSIIGSSLAAVVAAVTFLPLLYRLKLISSYEYLELRFKSKGVRRTGTAIIIICQLMYVGIGTYSPAVALKTVTGFPVWASILSVGLVATCYTTMGGMPAVVWADAFQCFVMLAGILSVIISGTIQVGGWQKVWEINKINGRINFWNFDPSPVVRMSFWSLTIGRMFGWLPWYAVLQTSVQRYCSVPSLRKAQVVMYINIPAQIVITILACTIGLVAFSYFHGCDPLEHPVLNQRINSPNEIVPLFVMKVLSWPGIPGLFLASIFSGSLSTVSSCLNALAAITWEDLLQWKFDYLSEKNKTNVLKLLVVIYGVLGIVLAFLSSTLQGTVFQVSVSFMSSAVSPIMGLFILGAFFTRANWLGAILGGCVGLILPMWINIGSYLVVPGSPTLPTSISSCVWNETAIFNSTLVNPKEAISEDIEGFDKLYTVSFLWLTTIGTVLTVLLGLIASILTGPFIDAVKAEDVKGDYLILALDRWPCKRQAETTHKADALDHTELKELKA